ncbi:hypothetical protein CG007_03080 [Mesoplasma entomophilum]|uniref:hypothetical protein n=1 Tax=Mesoplasma entomophilum TaxID=2149 RepID=UPI000D022642|nr:hypothetical protein [Mesoplasma entomophilum]AVN60572.1 hypothetical protein CG007_03080 [Mesoplasma entomophilum]
MKNCNYCKQSIKPYQLSRSGQVSSGAVYTPNNSNIGFVTTGGRIYTSHMGCFKAINKKYWPWAILALLCFIVACSLFIPGIINIFDYKSYNWENGEQIIDLAKKSKGVTELVFAGILTAGAILIVTIGYFYSLSFVRDGQHANDYIDEEAKLIYDAAFKKAKEELK